MLKSSNLIINENFNDNITSICFFELNSKNLLITSSLDHNLRIFEYSYNIDNQKDEAEFTDQKLSQQHLYTDPLTTICTDKIENKLIVGSQEGKIYLYDIASNKKELLGNHKQSIKSVFKHKEEEKSTFFSVSTDGILTFWDTRMRRSCFSYDFNGEYLCGSYLSPIYLACINDKDILYFNMNNIGYFEFTPLKKIQSVLGDKCSNIAIFPKQDGYAVTSNEGRCSVKYFEFQHESTCLNETSPNVNLR